MGRSLRKQRLSLIGREFPLGRSHQIDAPCELTLIDDDADPIAVPHLADRSAGQRFRADVPDARSRADTGEPSVRHDRHVLAPRQKLECRRDLVGLLHPASHGASTDQHHDVPRLHTTIAGSFDRRDRLSLRHEDTRRSLMPVHAIVDERRVDGRRLDDGSFGTEVASRKTNGAGHPLGSSPIRRQNHVVRVDTVGFLQTLTQDAPPVAGFPPVEDLVPRGPGDRARIPAKDSQATQPQHHFRNAAGQIEPHGGMVARTIGKDIDEPRHLSIDRLPILDRRAPPPRSEGNRRNVKQEVRRSAAGCVRGHRIIQSIIRNEISAAKPGVGSSHQCRGRSPGHVLPDRLAAGRQRCMGNRQPERLGNHLRRRRRPEELAASSR